MEQMSISSEEYLLSLLREDIKQDYNTIVFWDTQKTCDEISSIIFQESIPNLPYYAGLESALRLETLHQLYKGKWRVIVSTNILSRGIDTLNVGHVIQYNCARSIEDYIHRVGRTGRMGTVGKVTNLVRRSDQKRATKIIKFFQK